MENTGKKIAVIGAGNVGATIAYTLTLSGLAGEIALIDIAADKAEGEARDIMQGTAFSPATRVYSGDYSAIDGADVVIISAGVGRKPGQTRIDLCNINIKILRSVVAEIQKYASDNTIFVVVANPADILTYVTLRLSGVARNRVIGSGTLLDTSRLQTVIAEKIGLNNPQNVNAYVLGEHGDTSVVPWSLCTIAGMDFKTYCEVNGMAGLAAPESLATLETSMRTAGGEVIKRKGATFYAIAMSVTRICEAVLRDTKAILPVAGYLDGEYGISDVCLSLPYVVGANGLEEQVKLEMTPEEVKLLQQSGDALKSILSELEF